MCSETLPSPSESGLSSRNNPSNRHVLNPLRPYQTEIALAVLDSVFNKKGLTFSVEIARQGGKNELSAQLELLLLTLYITEPQNLIKCSPTFKPQAVISMMRLKDRLNDVGYAGFWEGELGYIIRLGNARAIFLSAEESANVVGNTAHILLEIDESQDVSKEKYTNLYYLQLNHSPSSWVVRQQRLHSRTLVGHQLPNPNFRLQKPAPLRLMYQG